MIEIVPYECVGPVKFGMTIGEVAAVLGEPERVSTNRSKERDECRGELGICFSAEDSKVVEVSLSPRVDVTLMGIDVFNDPSAFDRLVAVDGKPLETLGFVILMKLGITLTGFHDQDESQKAVTAFARGRWDHVREELRPFSRASRV